MRALVTGGRGFVGRWLASHLEASGDDVVAIDTEVEITDAEAVARAVADAAPDALYHLAAFSNVGRSWADPADVLRVNALGTLAVLEAARRLDRFPTVLLVSSAEVYGAVDADDLPIGESVDLAPVTPYAASKVAAEYLGVQAHLAHGLPVVRVRPFNHIGPGQAPGFVVSALASRIVDAQRTGARTIAVGNLAARRDLTDVRDVVRAYRMLVVDGQPGDAYNLCTGTDVAIEEVARRLIDLAGASVELEADPDLVRPVDVAVVRGDPSRLKAATGWEAHIDLDKTLTDVLDWWRNSGG